MKIALWTKSPYKIRLVKHVLTSLDFDPEVIGCEVESQVSEQPMKAGETKEWALHRAINALHFCKEADFWCGIEFGYESEEDDLYCITHVCIIDWDGKKVFGQSSRFLLPEIRRDWLYAWKELKEMFYEWEKNKNLDNISLGIFQYLWKDKMIIEALESAFISYYGSIKVYYTQPIK